MCCGVLSIHAGINVADTTTPAISFSLQAQHQTHNATSQLRMQHARRRIAAHRHLTSSPRRHLYGLSAYFMQLKLQMQRNLHFLHLLQQINVRPNAKL